MGQARSVIAASGTWRLRIMCDVYHMQRTEGNLTHAILEHFAFIDHVQIADPGRHQPGTGEINTPSFCKRWSMRSSAVGVALIPTSRKHARILAADVALRGCAASV